jgi:hypothetical protein
VSKRAHTDFEFLRIGNILTTDSSFINLLLVDSSSKKDDRRIHWADGSGKSLVASDGGPSKSEPEKTRKSRWSDKKKMEIQQEKDLLLQSRQAIHFYPRVSLLSSSDSIHFRISITGRQSP